MQDGWITMQQAAEYVGPRRGNRPTTAHAVRGWALHGLPSAPGVLLASELRGGVRMTTRAAVDEFFAALDGRKRAAREKPAVPSNAQAARAQRRARKQLEAMGAR